MSLWPFRATRYATHDLAAVTSPPYDVVEPAGFADLEMHPHNVVRLILPREAADCDRYEQAARAWSEWVSDGVLTTEDDPALWVYEQSGPAGDLIGVIGTVPIDQPGAVLPHENVMVGPVIDRADLMTAVGANLEPILLVHDTDPAVQAQPSTTTNLVDAERTRDCDICMEAPAGVTHKLWRITDQRQIDAINADLATRAVLIADGHHRFAAYQRMLAQRPPNDSDQQARRGLALIVDGRHHPLRLGAIHRSLPNLSLDDAVTALEKVGEHVVLEWLDPTQPLDDGSPSLRLTDGTRQVQLTVAEPDELVATPGRSKTWRSLPTSLLHEYLVPRVWEVEDADVRYHHDVRGVLAATRTGRLGILVPPMALPTVIELASEGELLPRKSTSFGPKPRTGLLMRTLR